MSDTEAGEAAVGTSEAVDDALLNELMARAKAAEVSPAGEGGLLRS